jgi:hypothetical protein
MLLFFGFFLVRDGTDVFVAVAFAATPHDHDHDEGDDYDCHHDAPPRPDAGDGSNHDPGFISFMFRYWTSSSIAED